MATPSREQVEQYRILRDEIEMLVGRINATTAFSGTPSMPAPMNTTSSLRPAAANRRHTSLKPIRNG